MCDSEDENPIYVGGVNQRIWEFCKDDAAQSLMNLLTEPRLFANQRNNPFYL